MLVTTKEMFEKAMKENYAIPAPDFCDLSTIKAFTTVAEDLEKPIILSFAEGFKDFMDLEDAAMLGKYYANKVKVPVALHLDHGEHVEYVLKAIDLGFTSVMIDASMDDFETNVAKTKQVVEYAHARGVVVEAEIGHVGSGVNYENHNHTDSIYTEVSDAVKFVELTGVDSLAISIGTAHGKYKGLPKINFERLSEIREAVKIPLVLHGGSSSGDENLNRCANSGISKINIFTDLVDGAVHEFEVSKPSNYFDYMGSSHKGLANVLTHYYEVFGSNK